MPTRNSASCCHAHAVCRRDPRSPARSEAAAPAFHPASPARARYSGPPPSPPGSSAQFPAFLVSRVVGQYAIAALVEH